MRLDSFLPKIAIFFPLIGLCGCAAGDVGTVMSRTTHADHALIIDAYTIGVSVRPTEQTRGVLFGWGHTTYLFANTDDNSDLTDKAVHWFHTPLPNRPPAAIASKTIGTNLALNGNQVGLGVGLEAYFCTRAPSNQSTMLQIHYAPSSPTTTVVQYITPKPTS